MPRFKKGSAEAKRYMAKIRNKKNKPKKAKKKKARVSGETIVRIPSKKKNRTVTLKRNDKTGTFESIGTDLFMQRNRLEKFVSGYKEQLQKLKKIPAKKRTYEQKNTFKLLSAGYKHYKKQLNQTNTQIKKHLK